MSCECQLVSACIGVILSREHGIQQLCLVSVNLSVRVLALFFLGYMAFSSYMFVSVDLLVCVLVLFFLGYMAFSSYFL